MVGAQTWGALVHDRAAGLHRRRRSRALQVELNKKRRLGLRSTASSAPATAAAVRSFQSHAGISADGVVGPTTWRNLIWHYAYPSLAGMCDQDPDGNGTANWGTGASDRAAGGGRRPSSPAPATGQVPLGDVGFEHGGDIPGHASHEVGIDVDLWPIRTDSAQCTAGRITWQSATYDRAATRRWCRRSGPPRPATSR